MAQSGTPSPETQTNSALACDLIHSTDRADRDENAEYHDEQARWRQQSGQAYGHDEIDYFQHDRAGSLVPSPTKMQLMTAAVRSRRTTAREQRLAPCSPDEAARNFEFLWRRAWQHPAFVKYRKGESSSKRQREEIDKWPEYKERLYFEGISMWPPVGKDGKFEDRRFPPKYPAIKEVNPHTGKKEIVGRKEPTWLRGRNELIIAYIYMRTEGKMPYEDDDKDRKTVSSHSQVLKGKFMGKEATDDEPAIPADPNVYAWLGKPEEKQSSKITRRLAESLRKGLRSAKPAPPPLKITREDTIIRHVEQQPCTFVEPNTFKAWISSTSASQQQIMYPGEMPQAGHILFQDKSEARQKDLYLNGDASWRQKYAVLAQIYDSGSLSSVKDVIFVDCPIHLLDSASFSSIHHQAAEMQQSTGERAEVRLVCDSSFRIVRDASLIDPDEHWQCTTTWMDDGKKIRADSRPLLAKKSTVNEGGNGILPLSLGSRLLALRVDHFRTLLDDPARHPELIEKVRNMNVVQEIRVLGSHSKGRADSIAAIIVWNFRVDNASFDRTLASCGIRWAKVGISHTGSILQQIMQPKESITVAPELDFDQTMHIDRSLDYAPSNFEFSQFGLGDPLNLMGVAADQMDFANGALAISSAEGTPGHSLDIDAVYTDAGQPFNFNHYTTRWPHSGDVFETNPLQNCYPMSQANVIAQAHSPRDSQGAIAKSGRSPPMQLQLQIPSNVARITPEPHTCDSIATPASSCFISSAGPQATSLNVFSDFQGQQKWNINENQFHANAYSDIDLLHTSQLQALYGNPRLDLDFMPHPFLVAQPTHSFADPHVSSMRSTQQGSSQQLQLQAPQTPKSSKQSASPHNDLPTPFRTLPSQTYTAVQVITPTSSCNGEKDEDVLEDAQIGHRHETASAETSSAAASGLTVPQADQETLARQGPLARPKATDEASCNQMSPESDDRAASKDTSFRERTSTSYYNCQASTQDLENLSHDVYTSQQPSYAFSEDHSPSNYGHDGDYVAKSCYFADMMPTEAGFAPDGLCRKPSVIEDNGRRQASLTGPGEGERLAVQHSDEEQMPHAMLFDAGSYQNLTSSRTSWRT